ncbi:hypothetical protein NECAME_13658 [Necator americanus]|uniref:Uncharacterized protein n=1 Tax=Necator americanus TaxID=51031 RepID=W2SVZ0_NECAM|nr:hypothetical protein NECAME_13658 [Necator americanus]ETN72991.1 hypothetical protein NECAME_13658 [Necator americanus]
MTHEAADKMKAATLPHPILLFVTISISNFVSHVCEKQLRTQKSFDRSGMPAHENPAPYAPAPIGANF